MSKRKYRSFNAHKISFHCDGCGSPLTPKQGQEEIICPYCGTEYILNWEAEEEETEHKAPPPYLPPEAPPAKREDSWQEVLSRGRRCEENGSISGAYACYREVLRLNPDNQEAWEGLERLRGLGNYGGRISADDESQSGTESGKGSGKGCGTGCGLSCTGCSIMLLGLLLLPAVLNLSHLLLAAGPLIYVFVALHKAIFPADFADGHIPLVKDNYSFIWRKNNPLYVIGAMAVSFAALAGAYYFHEPRQFIPFCKFVALIAGGGNLLFALACLITKKKWYYLPGAAFCAFIMLTILEK